MEFDAHYLETAAQVFLRPHPLYPWADIIKSANVGSKSGVIRSMSAVTYDTFRGFHRKDKTLTGARDAFVDYFIREQSALTRDLSAIRDREGLHTLSNRISEQVRPRLNNIQPAQLNSYNKIRKPVDLYIEHLVSMACELDDKVRAALVPLLFVPLDSQVLRSDFFSDSDRQAYKLGASPTYKDVADESTYKYLQEKLVEKARDISAVLRRRFHAIYFELNWSNRYRNWGGNLFERNPVKSRRSKNA